MLLSYICLWKHLKDILLVHSDLCMAGKLMSEALELIEAQITCWTKKHFD